MFKRIKRLIQLSKKGSSALKILENLTHEQLESIPDAGDGKSEFFSEGSEEDFKLQQQEDSGMKPWHELLKRL